MKKFHFSILLDSLFIAFIAFILSFVILNYAVDKPYSYILSGCISALLTLFAVKFFLSSRAKKYGEQLDAENFAQIMAELAYLPHQGTLCLFEKALKEKGYACVRIKNALHATQTECVHFFLFSENAVSKTDIVRAYNRLHNGQKAFIWSETFSKEVRDFADRFSGKILLKTGRSAYNLLKSTDNLPKITLPKVKARIKANALENLLDKKQAKRYAIFGIVFLIMSYFLPIKTYYIISGCIFLIMAIIVRLFGKTKQVPQENL